MTTYIKDSHTAIFTGPTDCGKSYLVLDLIEKEYSIIIICPRLRCDKTYHAKRWIKHDDHIWIIDSKGKLYKLIDNFS